MINLTETEKARFWAKVNKQDCWLWTASTRNGYGAFKLRGTVYEAHRLSWLIHFGEVPPKLLVCHKCDESLCVNPNHLFIGSHKENMQDASSKNRLQSKNRNFTDEQIKEIRELHELGIGTWRLSNKYKIPKSRMQDIVNRITYKNVT